MPELLLVVGNVVLWVLGIVGALVVVLFMLTAGRYEWRPNQSRRTPQPTMGRPPSGGSNVKPPPTCRHCGRQR